MGSQVLAVQKMQDYIEAHLTEEITLATLADICSFSPWYAHRLFREHTGNGGLSFRIVRRSLFQLPAHWYGRIRIAGR